MRREKSVVCLEMIYKTVKWKFGGLQVTNQHHLLIEYRQSKEILPKKTYIIFFLQSISCLQIWLIFLLHLIVNEWFLNFADDRQSRTLRGCRSWGIVGRRPFLIRLGSDFDEGQSFIIILQSFDEWYLIALVLCCRVRIWVQKAGNWDSLTWAILLSSTNAL